MDKRVAVSELDDTILTPMVVKEVLPGEALGHEHLSQNKVLHGLGARTKTMTELIVIPLPVYKRMVLPLQRERELEKASYLRAVSLLQVRRYRWLGARSRARTLVCEYSGSRPAGRREEGTLSLVSPGLVDSPVRQLHARALLAANAHWACVRRAWRK